MKKKSQMFNIYAAQHDAHIIKITHFIGVPITFFSIQLFLNIISFDSISLAWLLLIFLFGFYLFLDIFLALITAFFLFFITTFAQLVFYLSTHQMSLLIAILCFILGWVVQFIGHYYGKKKPAFLTNIFQMSMAPLFLTAEVCEFFGYSPRF